MFAESTHDVGSGINFSFILTSRQHTAALQPLAPAISTHLRADLQTVLSLYKVQYKVLDMSFSGWFYDSKDFKREEQSHHDFSLLGNAPDVADSVFLESLMNHLEPFDAYGRMSTIFISVRSLRSPRSPRRSWRSLSCASNSGWTCGDSLTSR